MRDYDVCLSLCALRRLMGDSVGITHPVTVDILFSIFQGFDWSKSLHVCMHAAFLVAFFSFLRISNLVPYTSADLHKHNAYFLRRRDISFMASGAVLRVYRTKIIQFHQRVLEIPLPFIPRSVLCPVTALRSYLFLVPAHSTSPLFVLPHGRLLRPIFALQFDQFFKSCISVVGLCPSQYSSRSFRRGERRLLSIAVLPPNLSRHRVTGKAMLILFT